MVIENNKHKALLEKGELFLFVQEAVDKFAIFIILHIHRCINIQWIKYLWMDKNSKGIATKIVDKLLFICG
ncbi:hypothetical protein HLI_09380 [Halobacillus litoralis]|uniref:Uncharacterized protein n=1 Tax=Halobacillus litoralis TaxID=45668 RepID=A0A410MCG4_9BACI|nr:hypothetical protein HLI_09380 [Halobacillus litoralis]